MTISLQENFFQLFNLPEQFKLDKQQLDSAYRTLQAQVHPDRYTTSPDGERRLALQWATLVNEAYVTLKQPLKRADYLCKLKGTDVERISNAESSTEFLMQQLNWRETLAEAQAQHDQTALSNLYETMAGERTAQFVQLEQALDQQHDTLCAARILRKLMFIEKFSEELENTLEALRN